MFFTLLFSLLAYFWTIYICLQKSCETFKYVLLQLSWSSWYAASCYARWWTYNKGNYGVRVIPFWETFFCSRTYLGWWRHKGILWVFAWSQVSLRFDHILLLSAVCRTVVIVLCDYFEPMYILLSRVFVPGVLLGEAEPKLVDQHGKVHEQTGVRRVSHTHEICAVQYKGSFCGCFCVLIFKITVRNLRNSVW